MQEAEALYKGLWTHQILSEERYKKLQAKNEEIRLLNKKGDLLQQELSISKAEVSECKDAYSIVDRQNRRLKTGISIIGGVVVIEAIVIAVLAISQ
jgi:hypothetical protein